MKTLQRVALVPLFLCTLAFGRCGGDPTLDPGPPSGANWKLVWSDEFEGPAGQALDTSKWGYDTGGSGWGNQQLEFDTDRTQNASLDGQGHLALTSLKESFGGSSYTSARILTAAHFSQAHGRFEARIQLPPGRGLWPAFWLLGANVNQVPWPGCGEIDIMEYRGQETGIIHGSVHGPGYSGGAAVTSSHGLPSGDSFAAGFHIFAVDWTKDRIDFRVDDTVYESVTPSSIRGGAQWVFEHPFFIILNLAVGGNYVGSPDATTVFPAVMLVDYVRVYEQAP